MLNSQSEQYELLSRRNQTKIEYLNQQNEVLESQIKILQQSKNPEEIQALLINTYNQLMKSQTQALLNLQISQQTEAFFLDLLQELEEKNKELRHSLHDKEYFILQLEKKSELKGVKEIVQLNEISLAYNQQIESLKVDLLKVIEHSQQLQKQLQQLQNENHDLKFKLQTIKSNILKYVNQDLYCKIIESVIDEQSLWLNNDISQIYSQQSVTLQTMTGKLLLQSEYDKLFRINQDLTITNEKLCKYIEKLTQQLEDQQNKIKQQEIYQKEKILVKEIVVSQFDLGNLETFDNNNQPKENQFKQQIKNQNQGEQSELRKSISSLEVKYNSNLQKKEKRIGDISTIL